MTMEAVMSFESDEDDEAFLRSLIRPEEDRRRLHPELPWLAAIAGSAPPMSYRWKDTGNGGQPSLAGKRSVGRFEAWAGVAMRFWVHDDQKANPSVAGLEFGGRPVSIACRRRHE